MPSRSWRSWHLVALFALGSVLEWAGKSLRDWSGDRLKSSWFGDDDRDDDDDEIPEPSKRRGSR